jgi:hypothetical protein
MTMDRRTLLAMLAALAALVATAAVGASGAVFSAQTANPGNSFDAAASFGDFRVVSGAYTGNAVDNRALTGVGFQPDLVIVTPSNSQDTTYRTSTMTGDASKPINATALTSNLVQSLNADGFTIGSDFRVNGSGVTYYWTAMKANTGVMKLGTYTGNGSASRSITGVGFSPEYVNVLSAGANTPRHRTSGMTSGFRFDTSVGATDSITSLNADGFSVGANADTNTSGTVYHYIAWNETAGQVKKGSYVGDGTDPTQITGVGFEPYYMHLRANDTVTGRPAVHRSQMNLFDSMRFDAANESNAITAFQSDGFQVGSNGDVNASGVTYHYVAFKDATGSCSAPGAVRLGLPSTGAYVDQATPTTNYGADATYRVRSLSGSQNRRTLVRFDLPTPPPGCSMTAADLYMYANTPTAGRTINVFRANASWNGGSVTWNTQPPITGTAAQSASLSAAGYQQWNVTTQVAAQYSGTNNGFSIRDSSEGGGGAQQIYDSDNGANVPILVVTFG